MFFQLSPIIYTVLNHTLHTLSLSLLYLFVPVLGTELLISALVAVAVILREQQE